MGCKEYLLVGFVLLNAHLGSSLSLYEYQIEIHNDARDTPLVIQCNNNGQQIGPTTINPRHLQSFFCPWIIKKRTVATCDMTLGKSRGRFDLFDSDKDLWRCKDQFCLWIVTEGGVSFNYELQYRWN